MAQGGAGARGRFVSLGAKLAAGMVAIVAATSTLVFRELIARERQHIVGAKTLAASMVADLFALGLAAPLDFGDADATAAEVANVKKNAEVSYAAAWPTRAEAPLAETGQASGAVPHDAARVTVLDQSVEVVRLVVGRDGRVVGSALVRLSLAAENAAYDEAVVRLVRVGAAAGVGMLLLLFLLVRREILAPLEGLAGAARRVERGEAGVTLALRANDEIGRLTRAFNAMSEAISDRETRLSAANASLEELFDNLAEGILVFGPDGRVAGASSRKASALFAARDGTARPLLGARIVDLLYPDTFPGDPEATALEQWIELSFARPASEWESLEELAPPEVVLFRGEPEERAIELEVRPIPAPGGGLARVMLLATDATERRRELARVRARGEAHEREVVALRRLVGGGLALVDFLHGARRRLERCIQLAPAAATEPGARQEILRHVHTLRGEARAHDLAELGAHLSAIEEAHARGSEKPGSEELTLAERLAEARALLGEAERTVARVAPNGEAALDQTTVSRRSLDELVEIAATRDDEIGKAVRKLAARPFGDSIAVVVEQVPRWAEESGKRAHVRVSGRDVLVPPALAATLGGVLAHLVRNAIAHGIEEPAARESAGKPADGEIAVACVAGAGAGGPVVTVEDDGRGLQGSTIAERAKELGLDAGDGIDVIFRDGFSTEAERSEAAGLGVGLAAVRADLAAARYGVRAERGASGGARFVLHPWSEP